MVTIWIRSWRYHQRTQDHCPNTTTVAVVLSILFTNRRRLFKMRLPLLRYLFQYAISSHKSSRTELTSVKRLVRLTIRLGSRKFIMISDTLEFLGNTAHSRLRAQRLQAMRWQFLQI